MRLFLVSMAILVASAARAQATRLKAVPPAAVVLTGSSNVTDWRCRATALEAEMVVDARADHINAVIDRIEDGSIGVWMANPSAGRFPQPRFTLRIPVSAFRCGNRVMESDLQAALNAERHPHAEFVFRELRGAIGHDIDAGVYHATIAGDLSLAGATRRIELQLSAQRLSRSTFRFRASLPLRMTSFGITPPSALFGAIRARDGLTVSFDLTLQVAGRI